MVFGDRKKSAIIKPGIQKMTFILFDPIRRKRGEKVWTDNDVVFIEQGFEFVHVMVDEHIAVQVSQYTHIRIMSKEELCTKRLQRIA